MISSRIFAAPRLAASFSPSPAPSPVDRVEPGTSRPIDVAAAMRGVMAAGTLEAEALWTRECRVPATHAMVATADGLLCGDQLCGGMFALDAASGEPRWTLPTKSLAGSVALGHGSLFGIEDKGKLHCVDPSTGTPRWSTDLEGTFGDGAVIAPDNSVVLLSRQGRIYKVDADGNVKWHRDLGRDAVARGPIAGADGTVYVAGHDLKLHAFDAQSGEPKWSREMRAHVTSIAADAAGNVYCAREYGRICAFDGDGNVRWDVIPPVSTNALDYRAPMLACGPDGRLYAGADKGIVFSLDGADGSLRWSRHVGNEARTAPSLQGGTLYWGGLGGRTTALEADSGWRAWQFNTGGDFASVPTVTPSGTVCVSDSRGTVYAVDVAASREKQVQSLADAPPPASGTIDLQPETVVINGIRIPRRPEPGA